METLIKTGRIFYGIMIACLGAQQIPYGAFKPVIFPTFPGTIPGLAILVYIVSALLILCGLAIIFEKRVREVSLILGGVLLLICVVAQIPFELINDPYYKHLGVWDKLLKELVFAGGAFAVAGLYPSAATEGALLKFLDKFVPFAGTMMSITMVLFGISHFLYVEFVVKLMPAWIPGSLFWTYFAGAALIASGITIILKIQLKLSAILLGVMLFLWFVMLHIPRAIADPYGAQGNELTSVFEALGFSGIAFMVAGGYNNWKRPK